MDTIQQGPYKLSFVKHHCFTSLGNTNCYCISQTDISAELTVDQLRVSHLIKYISFQPAYNFHLESSGIHQPAAVRVGKGAL